MQFKPWFSAIIVLAVLSLACPATAATLQVPADYPTIQSCIDAAVSGQDECVVAPGTYNELISFLGKAITLHSSHGPQVTTIDGTGLSGSVVTCVSNQLIEVTLDGFTITGGVATKANVHTAGGGVYIHSDPWYETKVLFNLRNAVITGNEAYYGGGIFVSEENTITLSTCEFTGNTARYGGGIFGNYFAKMHLDNALFQHNSAEISGGAVYGVRATFDAAHSDFIHNFAGVNGGAVAIENDFSFSSTESNIGPSQLGAALRHPTYVLVRQCTFELNTALGQNSNKNAPLGGGAIFSASDSTEIIGSSFTRNNGRNGGGILDWYLTAQISDCIFVENEAVDDGGAIYICESAISSLFIRNRAGGKGGGIFMGSAKSSTFRHNSALRGGGICFGSADSSSFFGNRATEFGGGLYGDSEAQLSRPINSLFVGNVAESGGGAYLEPAAPFYNSTFAFNISHGNGGGAVGAIPYNSIFWGNQAGASGHQLWNGDESFVPITSTDLQDSGGSANWNPANGLDQGGNIDLDPQFVRPPDDGGDGWGDQPMTLNFDESANDDFGDLRLSPGSPCINAGDSNFVASIPLDLDGHARVLCGRVDMGAYEFGIGDYDCDQTVNLVDLTAWEGCASDPVDPPFRLPAWSPSAPLIKGGSSGCEAFDFDADGDVDLGDFARFMLIAAL